MRREGRRKRNKDWLRKNKGKRGRMKVQKQGEIAVTSYNTQDGRNKGLLLAVRALNYANVGIAVIQEVKILDLKFALKRGFGYSILVTAAGTDNCGGVAVLARESDPCSVEGAKPWGPSVISWEIQVGKETEE